MKFAKLPFDDRQLPLSGIVVAVILLSVIALISLASIDEFQNRVRWVDHTHEIISELEKTLSLMKDAETGERGYVITGNPEFLEPYEKAKERMPGQLLLLRKLLADTPKQLVALENIERLMQQEFVLLTRVKDMRSHSNQPDAAALLVAQGNGKWLMDSLRVQVADMQHYQSNLLVKREAEAAVSANHSKLAILFGTGIAYLIIGGAFYLLNKEVDQRQRAEAALHTANDRLIIEAQRLEAVNKELESFSYTVSHDLRIPLRAISGYTTMLEEDYGDRLDAEGHRLLDVIRNNGKRMGELIDDLLAFSRLGRQALSCTEVDMNELISTVAAQLGLAVNQPESTVRVEKLPSTWGDRSLLQQVWANLISNALKYSGTKSHPEIRLAANETKNETIYIVSDNGVGFDSTYADKLFGVFQRLHTADEFPGTGVGLAIVHRIVTRHGGRVWAESILNEGAKFYFALPKKGFSS